MAKIPFDFSKFGKISTSDKKTTLKHKDGHFMVVAHKALDGPTRKALDALPFASGGKVPKKEAYKEQPASKAPGSARAGVRPQDLFPEKYPKQQNPKLEEAKKPALADGGEVADPDPKKAAEMQQGATESGFQPDKWAQNIKEGLGMADGGEVKKEEEEIKSQELQAEPGDPNSPEAQVAPAPASAPEASSSPGPQPEVGPVPAAPMPQAPAQPQSPKAAPSPTISQQILGERNNIAQDLMSGQIVPKTYANLYADKGVPGKIGTIFGLMLSGIGSGLSHQPNALMAMMDKTIERDVDAQKQNRSNAQSFYKIAQQQVMNDAITKRYAAENGLTNAQAKDKLAEAGMAQFKLEQARTSMSPAQEAHVDTLAKHTTELSAMHQLDQQNQKLPPGSPIRQAADAALSSYAQKKLMQDQPAEAQKVEDAYTAEQDAKNATTGRGPQNYPVLEPDALRRSIGITQTGLADNPKLQSQLSAARQVEKVLNGPKGDGSGGIHELLSDMYDDIGRGSFSGGLEQRIKSNVEKLPFVGHGAEGALNVLGQGEGYKEYTQKATALKQDIASALKGLVIPSDLDKLIDPLLPTLGDTPEDIARKEKQIVQTILKSLPHDELDKFKLTRAEYR